MLMFTSPRALPLCECDRSCEHSCELPVRANFELVAKGHPCGWSNNGPTPGGAGRCVRCLRTVHSSTCDRPLVRCGTTTALHCKGAVERLLYTATVHNSARWCPASWCPGLHKVGHTVCVALSHMPEHASVPATSAWSGCFRAATTSPPSDPGLC